MDQTRPYIIASKEPCYDVNPTLWNLYCALTGRAIGQANYNWTEQDVIIAMLARGLQKHDFGTNDTDNEPSESVQSGRRYDIRRDLSTGNVMAVRKVSDSDDAVLFVIGS